MLEKIPVMFRVSKNDSSDVFALFPTIPGTQDLYTCTCYQHVGQHSSADIRGCVKSSRPATPEEMASLLRELKRVYQECELVIVQRTTRAMTAARHKELRA